MMSGIFFLAMPLTIVGGAFNNEWAKIENVAQISTARQMQKEDQWKLAPGQIEQISDSLEQHIRRMQQHLEECERIAPDGDHWNDLEDKLKSVAIAVEHCKGLYAALDVNRVGAVKIKQAKVAETKPSASQALPVE